MSEKYCQIAVVLELREESYKALVGEGAACRGMRLEHFFQFEELNRSPAMLLQMI